MAKYECSRQGDCQITTATRNICKFCRYQKCLDVGMKPDGTYTVRTQCMRAHNCEECQDLFHGCGGC